MVLHHSLKSTTSQALFNLFLKAMPWCIILRATVKVEDLGTEQTVK